MQRANSHQRYAVENTYRRPQNNLSRVVRWLPALLVCLLLGVSAARAQNVQYTSKSVDKTKRSGFRVDPSTLGLNVEIPIAAYPGRDGTGLPITLNYSSKLWRMKFVQGYDGTEGSRYTTWVAPTWSEHTAAGWTTTLDLPTFTDEAQETYTSTGSPTSECFSGCWIVRKVTVQLPDGSTHILRHTSPTAQFGANPSGTYYAWDGSGIRYEYDSKTLYLADGSRYVLGWLNFPATVTTYTDSNGNTLSYNPATHLWTDTLGRTFGYPPMNVAAGNHAYSIPGVGNTSMPYTFKWKALADALTDTSATLHSVGDCSGIALTNPPPGLPLFQSLGGDSACEEAPGGYFNPTVLAEIVLPDNTSYKFTYNVYGEIDKVVYPTGGYERFVYDAIQPVDWIFGVYAETNRGVVDQYISATGASADEVHWHYEAGYLNGSNTQPYKVKLTAPDGTYTERYLNAAGPSVNPWNYNDVRIGRAYDERFFTSAGQMLSRTLTQWIGSNQGTIPNARDPRMDKQVEITLDTGTANALTRTTTYAYDVDLNVTATSRYDYVQVSQSTGQSGAINSIPLPTPATPLRTDESTFLVNDVNLDSNTRAAYRARNLLRLSSSSRVRDGAGNVIAQSEVRYDESNFPLFTYGQVTSWVDPQTAVRGNPTTARQWLDTTNVWLETHARYDQCGSVKLTWDAQDTALTNPTQYDYSSTFSFAYPTTVTSSVPDPTNTFGTNTPLVTSTAYDLNTGSVTSTTDANNKTTTNSYTDDQGNVDAFNRLRKVTYPDGGTTSYLYDRNQYGDYVRTMTALDPSRSVTSYQFFDGLGRPSRSFLSEGGSPLLFLTADTQYDNMGRVWRASNPYRSTGSDQPINPSGLWTTNEYDALGRVKKITTPDGSFTTAAYAGNTMTATDQMGRQRRRVTDALGRLVRVDEPDKDSGALDSGSNPIQPTSYGYDALGNLRTVTQGTQTRTFVYNSLSRLTSAQNPESGTVSYTYDNNGNLLTRTDARGVVITYGYDNLDRNTTITYADSVLGSTNHTKDVERHYDGAINGKGRFWYFNWDAGGNQTRFDSHTAIDQYDEVGRPLKQRQRFLTNGATSLDYTTTRTYDLAGNVLTQTYPSGHTIRYNYDAAGRPGDNPSQIAPQAFKGNLGDGVTRVYADQISYGEFGGIRQERFGTQTALYHKMHYNRRGQLFDIRLSTQSLASNEWDWNRGAVVNYYSGNLAWEGNPATPAATDNNGNLRQQQHWVPGDDATSTYTYTQQTFDYDQLNRLKSVSERHGTPSSQSGQDFIQRFDYDRWGNRWINLAQSSNVPAAQFDFERGDLQNSNRLYAPGDLQLTAGQRRMQYDAAGNLAYDSYTGTGGRVYDAENRMTAASDNSGNTATYTYDADGRRVKRKVANEETWQVYGMSGELLAEYPAGVAPFLATKEYGYRGGELLVTISSGDVDRLKRFVKNLYYNSLARDPSASELAAKMNDLAQAGAQGETQLLSAAKSAARSLFESTEYVNRNRTTSQYVTDLYNAYLQRGPDSGGLNFWVNNTNQNGRAATLNAFEVSTEFAALGSTVYGTAAGEDQRVDAFVRNFYYGAFQREPTSTEAQQQRQRLNNAAAVSRDQVIAEARAMGVELIQSTNYNASHTTEQYVTDLYQAFLQRSPDSGGLNFWVSNTNQNGRAATLDAFRVATEYAELAGTLYHETFWLVSDQLGTPRMAADKSGSLAGIKRHDYLPFGEELFANASGRTLTQGYSAVDNVRQKFTKKERDAETNLDYFLARYYSSAQGRFTSPDEFTGGPDELYYFADDASDNPTFYADLTNPQSLNKYQYAYNNPLRYVDPDGHEAGDQQGPCSCREPRVDPADPNVDPNLVTPVKPIDLMDLASPLPKPEPPDVNKSLVPEGWTVGGAHSSPLPKDWQNQPRLSPSEPTASKGGGSKTERKTNTKKASPQTPPQRKERRPYPPARRDYSRTKKEAEEKARRAGKGKDPINHPRDPHGPHFHPNLPKNDPRHHDHYFYPGNRGVPKETGPLRG